MNPHAPNSTLDLTRSRLRLRDDLLFVPQRYRGQTYYHVESTAASTFYRIGYAEYVFVSLLDGETTFAEALAITAQKLGAATLTTSQALSTYMWLLENHLGSLVELRGAVDRRRRPRANKDALLRQLNPFWIKLPLCRPDRAVKALVPWMGWFFSPLATTVGMLLILAALLAVALHSEAIAAASDRVFAPSNWLWLGLTWIGLKIVHEGAHALASRRYGGEVKEMGLVFILLAPMAYVDVTPSWRLPSKWQRIHIATAGMYAELLVAALATFVWLRTDSGIARHLLYNLMVMASISTLVFNANPLMRFDGYFILSDLLEIPNLYAEGAKAVRRHIRWLFLGESSGDPCPLGTPAWLMALYGWATAAWRVMVCVSLTIVASVLFHGAGIVIAAAGVLAWLGLPLLGVARELGRLWGENRATFWRCTGLAATLASCATLLLCWMPAPARVSVPGVVEYRDVVELRSLTPGFIREILVADGQTVEAGELLMRLENPDVSNLYHDLLLSIEQAEQRYRLALDDHEISAAQVEQRNRLALEERLVDARRRFEALQVRAPVSGEVIRRSLAHTLGTYVDERSVLLSIANERSKELVVSVSQQDFDNAVPSLGDTVYVRVGSQPRVPGRLVRLEPRASTELPHASLAASEGGSLAVVESRQPQANGSETALELTEARFRGIVSLPPRATAVLFSGQRGRALIGWHREPWGVRLIQSTRDWIDRKRRGNRRG